MKIAVGNVVYDTDLATKLFTIMELPPYGDGTRGRVYYLARNRRILSTMFDAKSRKEFVGEKVEFTPGELFNEVQKMEGAIEMPASVQKLFADHLEAA